MSLNRTSFTAFQSFVQYIIVKSSAYANFFAMVVGKSYVYKLTRRGANTDPWETTFLRRLNLLLGPVPVVRVKLRLRLSSMVRFTMCLSGTKRNSLQVRPRSHTAPYTAVRLTNTATSLLFGREAILKFFGKKGNLIHSRASKSKAILLVGE